MAAGAARNAILKHLKVKVQAPVAPSVNLILSRGRYFSSSSSSDDVRGSFLDKSEVSDRIISVVKNFQKVDPSKKSVFNISLILYIECICPVNKNMKFTSPTKEDWRRRTVAPKEKFRRREMEEGRGSNKMGDGSKQLQTTSAVFRQASPTKEIWGRLRRRQLEEGRRRNRMGK
ncbi:hypothetical protein ACLOJK_035855 [Asimina triloba]